MLIVNTLGVMFLKELLPQLLYTRRVVCISNILPLPIRLNVSNRGMARKGGGGNIFANQTSLLFPSPIVK